MCMCDICVCVFHMFEGVMLSLFYCPVSKDRGGAGEEEAEGKQEVKEQGDPDALKGSHGSRYGGDCDLLRDQFELYSPVSKKQQMCLLQVCILYNRCMRVWGGGD